MYIFKSDPPDGADEYLTKSSRSPLASPSAAEVGPTRLQIAAVVPAQTASLAGAFAPSGLVLSSIAESIAAAGVISNIGRPFSEEYVTQAANENSANAITASLEAFSKSLLTNLGDASLAIVPIASLSDTNLSQAPAVTIVHSEAPIANSTLPVIASEQGVIDISIISLISTPVIITALSDNSVTVIDGANANVQISDFIAPVATVESFINTGTGTLTVTTAATNIASLSLSGNVVFTALGDEITSGITVSGESDSSNVTLFLVGGASSAQGSSDFITLGNGNDFVFDAGNGQVLLNLGSGENTVLLSGVGVTGVINLASHAQSLSDFVALAPNGLSSSHDFATNDLVTIAGLNNSAQSHDAITFLGDMDSQLLWAGGTGNTAQVTSAAGDASNLASWISAAQAHASNAHNVAWFQFGGNTYVLEAVSGNAGNHAGDTLIKLTGLTQFTGDNNELSIGMLHLAG